MFLKRLILLTLVALYAVTGSVATYAVDADCRHGSFSGQATVPVALAVSAIEQDHSAPRWSDESGTHCTGFCHLLSIAALESRPDFRRLHRAAAPVQLRPDAFRAGHTLAVPTPPPDFV